MARVQRLGLKLGPELGAWAMEGSARMGRHQAIVMGYSSRRKEAQAYTFEARQQG